MADFDFVVFDLVQQPTGFEVGNDFVASFGRECQSFVLSALGRAYWALEFRQEAMDAYEREAAILRDSGDRFAEAVPRYNIALLARELWAQGLVEQDEFLSRLDEALHLSVRTGERKLEALVPQ